jgi:hypothetical protein
LFIVVNLTSPVEGSAPKHSDREIHLTTDTTRVVDNAAAVERQVPDPIDSGKSFVRGTYQVDGAKVEQLSLIPWSYLTNYVWSSDGTSLYVCTKSGTVSRLTFPGFIETVRLETGIELIDLGMTKAGLAILSDNAKECWVLDPELLRVIRRFAIQGGQQMAASPNSEVAYIYNNVGDEVLEVLDMTAGRSVHRITSETVKQDAPALQPLVRGLAQKGITLSLDGKYLLLVDEELTRLRVDGTELIYEESGPAFAPSGAASIGADGHLVAVPISRKSRPIDGWPPVIDGLFVFHLADLNRPPSLRRPGPRPQTVRKRSPNRILHAVVA